MAYEFLQKLFGKNEDGTPKAMTFAELQTAIEADKNLNIINLADGGYVTKDKLDAKITELNGVKQQLDDANKEIKSYKDMDIDGIKQKAADWETKYTTETQALNDKLATQAREHAEEMFLSGYKFTSTPARKGVLDELRAKKFQIENGTILGGKEFMQSLMENEEYKGAFVTETKDEGNKGNGSGTGSDNQPGAGNQNMPRFSQGTNQNQPGQNPNTNPFNFGFNMIRQPKTNNQ